MSKVTLFSRDETNFLHRGLGTLRDCIDCIVKEQKNGFFELCLIYPLHGNKSDLIREEVIVRASTPRGDNLFRIYSIKQDDEESLKEAYASQVFYDLEDNFIEDTNIVNKNGIGAINQVLGNTQYGHSFTGVSDIANIANSRLVRRSPVAAILDTDEDNCLLNRWGGELQRDNFNISLLTRYGADRGVAIKYGKNLLGLSLETNMKAVATKIMPQGYDALLLPEKYVDSPLIGNYAHPKILKYEFSDIRAQVEGEEIQEGELPLEQAYQALRDSTNALYASQKIDIPPTNLRVNFVELGKTEEYKDYAVLEEVYPFDTVTVKHSKLGLNIKVDMVYYEWDSLRDKYIIAEFGSMVSSFVETVATIATIKKQLDGLEVSTLKQAKETATGLINSGLGGYILKTRDELLVMDTDNINTAQKIWRWNLNGLGYSSTGYNGEFGLAMTKDGAIVADFITSGILDAGIMKAGILSAITIQSLDGKVKIDLSQSGKVEINGGALVVKNNNAEVVIDGQYNMHKIVVSGSLQLAMEVGETVISHQITHGLGYAPCNAAYAELISSGNTYVYAFPYISYVNFSSGMIGIGFLGRCWASSSVLEFVFNRPIDRATTREVVNIRYYIYKEVAI